MSSRSCIKRITLGSRTLKFLREQAGLSLRMASQISGVGTSVLHHLEHGRIDISDNHLERILDVYKSNRAMYEMFASGKVKLPLDLRSECMALVSGMTFEQLQTVHPVLMSLAK